MEKQYHPVKQTKSDKLKAHWKNGVYKNVSSTEANNKRRESIRKARQEGKFLTPNELQEKTQDPKYDHVAKGVKHHRSKLWTIKSPEGILIKGINLSQIVRDNMDKFIPDDVVWGGPSNNQCRAVCCISNLQLLKPNGEPRRKSWKGWTLVSVESLENP